jgi:hypothetical protein
VERDEKAPTGPVDDGCHPPASWKYAGQRHRWARDEAQKDGDMKLHQLRSAPGCAPPAGSGGSWCQRSSDPFQLFALSANLVVAFCDQSAKPLVFFRDLSLLSGRDDHPVVYRACRGLKGRHPLFRGEVQLDGKLQEGPRLRSAMDDRPERVLREVIAEGRFGTLRIPAAVAGVKVKRTNVEQGLSPLVRGRMCGRQLIEKAVGCRELLRVQRQVRIIPQLVTWGCGITAGEVGTAIEHGSQQSGRKELHVRRSKH